MIMIFAQIFIGLGHPPHTQPCTKVRIGYADLVSDHR